MVEARSSFNNMQIRCTSRKSFILRSTLSVPGPLLMEDIVRARSRRLKANAKDITVKHLEGLESTLYDALESVECKQTLMGITYQKR